jgi:uncharacterized RDD family membrane protein YckC
MDVGWWIRSTDEEVYGPVSRATIWRYLEGGVLTADTLVRHSAAVEFHPVGDQVALRDGAAAATSRGGPDRLADVWPRARNERLALAEGPMRCVRHRRPATQICMCCLAPYCERCRTFRRKAFYYCKRCQARLYHTRAGAFILDGVVAQALQFGLSVGAAAVGDVVGAAAAVIVWTPTLVFMVRDPLCKGAGPGKRVVGLKAVRTTDPTAPLTYGQGFIRSIVHLIPLVNLLDLSVPYRDPLWRRWGDRWAKTRVVYTPEKLEKIRAKATRLIQEKVGECLPLPAPAQEQLVRLAG